MVMSMRAMILDQPGQPLRPVSLAIPEPGPGQVLVKVSACGVCRTDLHVVDGDLTAPKLPLIPGHEITGAVAGLGAGVSALEPDQRIGVPWLGRTCGSCACCRSGRENLCDAAAFTGYTLDGGYAEYAVAEARFCFPIPGGYSDTEAAPLLCAGLIGYRSYRMVGVAKRLGVYGFGAAAHIITQIAVHQGKEVFAFTKPGDTPGQAFARGLGATWVGGSDEPPPVLLDAALIFAPVGALVPAALRAVGKGGVVICAGIHMSEIPSFPYELLWGERTVRSVANLTRQDGLEFFGVARMCGVRTVVVEYPLERANEALGDLRAGHFQGAAVLNVQRPQGAR
jgi:propanol-preferring alcohol dehydrogenase